MSDAVQIALIATIPGVVASIFGYLSLRQSRHNGKQMNSRMDEMLEMKGTASEAIGEARERKRANDEGKA